MHAKSSKKRLAIIGFLSACVSCFAILLILAFVDRDFLMQGGEFNARSVLYAAIGATVLAPILWLYIKGKFAETDSK